MYETEGRDLSKNREHRDQWREAPVVNLAT